MFEELPLLVSMPLGPSSGNFTLPQNAYQLETRYGLLEELDETLISHNLSLSSSDAPEASQLNAMIRGRIRFLAATSTEPAQIELEPLPFEQVQLGERLMLPALPSKILYGNIDPASLNNSIPALLSNSGLTLSASANVQNEFLSGDRWLTVEAGTLLGQSAVDPSLGGRRRLDLAMKSRDDFFLNPAYFLFEWPIIDSSLEAHPLILALVDVQHRMLFATKSRILYVKQEGTDVPPFTTPTNAARTIGGALGEAQPGDVVIVLDSGSYQERIFMPDGVHLTSKALRDHPWREITNSSGYPTIGGPGPAIQGPIVVFQDLGASSGISGFVITGGNGANGHGIQVRNCKNVEVAHNVVKINGGPPLQTAGSLLSSGGGVSVVDSSAIVVERNHILQNGIFTNHGGGLFVMNSRVKIARNQITQNQALGTGGGMAIHASPQVRIAENHIAENRAVRGGGIAIDGSEQITIEQNNVIRANRADDFGAGIALTNSRKIKIQKNLIGGNDALDGNITDNNSADGFSAIVMRDPRGGGGGIGVYDSDVTIIDNRIINNEAHRGGGIEFYAFGSGVVDHNEIRLNRTRPSSGGFFGGGDGGGVAINRNALNVEDAARYRRIELVDNAIEENRAGGDGGGVYATAGGELTIRGSFQTINRNTAQDNGGGVRATFGVRLTISSCKILQNECNLGNTNASGGGVSFRNATASISSCEIRQNKVHNYGGGGISAALIDEPSGGAEYVPGAPTALRILQDAYNFSIGELVVTGSTISDNEAIGERGAGAGIYLVYSKFDTHVNILNSSVSSNNAHHTDPQKRKNIVFQDDSFSPNPIINDESLPPLSPLQFYDVMLEP